MATKLEACRSFIAPLWHGDHKMFVYVCGLTIPVCIHLCPIFVCSIGKIDK